MLSDSIYGDILLLIVSLFFLWLYYLCIGELIYDNLRKRHSKTYIRKHNKATARNMNSLPKRVRAIILLEQWRDEVPKVLYYTRIALIAQLSIVLILLVGNTVSVIFIQEKSILGHHFVYIIFGFVLLELIPFGLYAIWHRFKYGWHPNG